MARNGKWKTFESGLARLSVGNGKSYGCLKKPLRICAAWTGPTLVGSNGANGTLRWSMSRKLPRRCGFPSHNFSGVFDRLAPIVPASVPWLGGEAF